MKWKNLISKHFIYFYRHLGLPDKCLLIFMIILMLQSINNLFFHPGSGGYSTAIDAVVRTTAAAIFGYFLSTNFMRRATEGNLTEEELQTGVENSGEVCEPKRTAQPSEMEKRQLERIQTRYELQIIIITAIGVISLIMLVIVRDFVELSPGSMATLSQLRDFVSGAVGLLIGSAGIDKKK